MPNDDSTIRNVFNKVPPNIKQTLQNNINVNDGAISNDVLDILQILESNYIIFDKKKHQEFAEMVEEFKKNLKKNNKDSSNYAIAKSIIDEYDDCCKKLSVFSCENNMDDDAYKKLERISVDENLKNKQYKNHKMKIPNNRSTIDDIMSSIKSVTGIDVKNLKTILPAIMEKIKSSTGAGKNDSKTESEKLTKTFSPKPIVSNVSKLAAFAMVNNVIPLMNVVGFISSVAFMVPMAGVALLFYKVSPFALPIVGSASSVDTQKAQSTVFNFIKSDTMFEKGTIGVIVDNKLKIAEDKEDQNRFNQESGSKSKVDLHHSKKFENTKNIKQKESKKDFSNSR